MFLAALFYLIVFGIILILLKNNKSKKRILFAYGMLFLLYALRYDIGNDYNGYFDQCLDFARRFRGGEKLLSFFTETNRGQELIFPLLSWVFSFSDYPWVWVNAIYSFVFIFCAYKVFNKHNIHAMGWLVIVLCEFVFFSWDRVRQGTSIMIILYAATFIENEITKKSLIKFIITLAIALLFHNSAVIGLIYLLLRFFKTPHIVLIGLIVVTGFLMWSGVLSDLIQTWSLLFEQVEGYEAYSYVTQSLDQFTSINYKLRMTLYLLLGASTIFTLPRNKYNIYENSLVLGLFIFAVACGSMTFTRIAWILMISFVIIIPIAFKESKGIKKTILFGVFMTFSLLFLMDLFSNKMTLGCLPYDSILSPNMYNHYFRPR